MKNSLKNKTLLVTNIPTPYRIPLYEKIAENQEDFSVWFLQKKEKNRDWKVEESFKFNNEFLKGPSFNLIKGHFDLHLKFIFFKLLKSKPQAVITAGYDQPAYWQAFLYCKLFRKKYVLFNGSTALSSHQNKGLFSFLKKTIIKYADSYITYGSKAGEYLEMYGADKNKISIGCNTVDLNHFYQQYESFIKTPELKSLKTRYENKKVFLSVSRLIEYKGIDLLFDVFKNLKDSGVQDWHWLIIGTGPDAEVFKKQVQEKGLEEQVIFLGNIDNKEIYKYYSLSDIFLFPTQVEPWGLVVNEALVCGNYVLCSDKAAAGYDLINQGENGEVLDFNNKELVENLIKKLLQQDFDREKISQSVRWCSIENYANKVLEAVSN